jgi:NAD(P)-dependent dehydrogenase (short-subunit alcohol dehydrogenase family)
MELQGRVAFVTGAASGIGAATARLFAEEGATVIGADISGDRIKDAMSRIDRGTGVAVDVSDSAAVRAAFDQVDREHGRLDILVNAAGVDAPSPEAAQRLMDTNMAALAAVQRGEAPSFDFVEETSDEDFRRVMEINLFSQFYCLRSATPLLKRAGGGSVVNISSAAALVGVAMPLYYPASKAGVLGLTRAAAAELAPYGIRVNAIAPGSVDTPLMQRYPDEFIGFLTAMQPIKRLATAEELARTILFLAGDEGGFYTGQTFEPNGGMHM